VELKNVNRQLLFPTAVWMIEYDNYQGVNQGILDEMSRVDWEAEHRRSGRAGEAHDRYLEDIFITTELVPSAEAILSAFVHGCEQIAEESEWDLVSNEIRVSDLWAHVTPPGKNTQRHHHLPDHLSCAYYVRTPEDCGNLRLLDDRKYRIGEPDSATPNALTGHWVDVPAREGLMVIFPSWLSHQVGENRSDEPRVSLSMNAALLPKGSPYGVRPQGVNS
jgi:uncharacterized protein (TIGR02466 family)